MAKRKKYKDSLGPRDLRKIEDDEFMDELFHKISIHQEKKARGEIIDRGFETDIKGLPLKKVSADFNDKLKKALAKEIEEEKTVIPERSILFELKGLKDSYITKTNIEITESTLEYIANEKAKKEKAKLDEKKDDDKPAGSGTGGNIKYYLLAAAAVAIIVSLYYFLSEENEAVRNDPGKMLAKHFTLSRADSLKASILMKDLEKIASNGMDLSTENVRMISEKLRIFDPESARKNFGVGENLAGR